MWEKGSGDAERLCADLLRIEGFEDVDPQHPLGGPDGGKDILCEKEGNTFVAGVYFPRGQKEFRETKSKYSGDLSSSLKHKRDGFIFLTNQELTVGERTELEKLAAANGKRCLIYHRERLRVMLDGASGFPLRLAHLGVPMSVEEQAAFFSASGQSVTEALKAQTRAIYQLSQKVSRIGLGTMNLIAESQAVVIDAVRDPAKAGTDVERMLKAAAQTAFQRAVENPGEGVSSALTPAILRYFHRLLLPTETSFAGKFRETQVWLVDAHGKTSGRTECPAWDAVPTLIDELLADWTRDYPVLIGDPEAAISAIARFFHRLTWIHPFVDGNGRLARAMLCLQARELLELSEDPILDRGAAYYSALMNADGDDFEGLEDLISAAVDRVR